MSHHQLNFINNVYTISASIAYNSERSYQLEDLLLEYLRNPKKDYNIIKEYKKVIENQRNNYKGNLLNVLFNNYDKIRSTLYYSDEYNDYIINFYKPFLKEFKEKWGFSLRLFTLLNSSIYNYIIYKASEMDFNWDIYEFKNKKEYANPYFIKIPKKKYIKKWSKIITFNPFEIIKPFSTYFPIESVLEVFNLISFDVNTVLGNEFKLTEKPILKISDDKYIILIPRYAITSLIRKLYNMFTYIPKYNNKKGILFERRVLKLLDSLPKVKLFKNVRYNKYEIDGILNLKKSTWFVECSSHQPSEKSFKNDEERIIFDLNNTVVKCERQALRAINNIEHPNIKSKVLNNNYGIFIILDGFYPNLNIELPFPIIKKLSNYKRIVINYFDLFFLMRQPQKNMFEEYLIWRTQKNFPINGVDETDVWTYFLNTKDNDIYHEGFEIAREKKIAVSYIGNRFNDKRYLNKFLRE